MEGTNKNGTTIDPEAKWIRLQKIGLAMLFVMPFAILLAAVTKDAVVVSLVFLALIVGGNVCLRYGKKQIMKLRAQEDSTE